MMGCKHQQTYRTYKTIDSKLVHEDKKFDELSVEKQKEIETKAEACDKWCPKKREA